LRTAGFQNVFVRDVKGRMKFEERIGRGAVIRPVQRFKDGDDIGVTHDVVGQRERKDDLEFERCHVTVYRYFL